jgi:beta-glucosidase/6-phospho-beta-glucosidase/beta-galactosidase
MRTSPRRATSEGVPVDGHFLRSAQDNFEWVDGFGTRFGLIYVDFNTLERIPSSAPSGSGRQHGKTRWCRARGAGL